MMSIGFERIIHISPREQWFCSTDESPLFDSIILVLAKTVLSDWSFGAPLNNTSITAFSSVCPQRTPLGRLGKAKTSAHEHHRDMGFTSI